MYCIVFIDEEEKKLNKKKRPPEAKYNIDMKDFTIPRRQKKFFSLRKHLCCGLLLIKLKEAIIITSGKTASAEMAIFRFSQIQS